MTIPGAVAQFTVTVIDPCEGSELTATIDSIPKIEYTVGDRPQSITFTGSGSGSTSTSTCTVSFEVSIPSQISALVTSNGAGGLFIGGSDTSIGEFSIVVYALSPQGAKVSGSEVTISIKISAKSSNTVEVIAATQAVMQTSVASSTFVRPSIEGSMTAAAS